MSLRSDINSRIDSLFGDVVIGAYLGKMVGDWAALKLTLEYGTEAGLEAGIMSGVLFFVLWNPLEKWLQGDYEEDDDGKQAIGDK